MPRSILSSLQEQDGGAMGTKVPLSSLMYGTIATWYFPLGRKWVKRTKICFSLNNFLCSLTFDILARVLVEGDVLRVDDGTGGLVMPAVLVSKGEQVIRVITAMSRWRQLFILAQTVVADVK